jgi:hypothetical protein
MGNYFTLLNFSFLRFFIPKTPNIGDFRILGLR